MSKNFKDIRETAVKNYVRANNANIQAQILRSKAKDLKASKKDIAEIEDIVIRAKETLELTMDRLISVIEAETFTSLMDKVNE